MKYRPFVFITSLIVVLFMVVCAISQNDVFMKQKMHTDAMEMMGQVQPAKDEIQTIWIAPDKMRSENPQQSIILRLDQNKMYVLDHAQKTYVEMPLNFGATMEKKIGESMDEKNMDQEEQAAMMNMMKGMSQMKLTITPTQETKKVGQWNCRKYEQSLQTMMGPTQGEIWATEELDMDPELYAKWSAAMMGQGGMFGNMMQEMAAEMKKIKGVPVLTQTTVKMMGTSVKSIQELIEFKKGSAPSGYFDIPAGYKKTDKMGF